MKPTLLIIDDDKDFISDFVILLSEHFECKSATTGTAGIKLIEEYSIDIVLLDLMFDNGPNGMKTLKDIKNIEPDLPVIMITDYASIDTATEAMRLGAYDYVSKTPNLQELQIKIKRSLKEVSLKIKAKSLQKESSKEFFKIVGSSIPIKQLINVIDLYAENNNTVIITGESGVGKELVARQIHLRSNYSNEPFVTINCAAIPKDLLESELFGHEKGAFTSAVKSKPGKFEIASPGTIFLDEISELSLDAQVKLLRVIQNKEFERVGGTKTISTNARIIAATNKNLEELKNQNKFREDLFYRLNVLPIYVPPLRERKEDIDELVLHFAKKICDDLKCSLYKFSEESIKVLKKYDWPGNIRELQNHLIRAIILAKDSIIKPVDLDSKIAQNNNLFSYKINSIPQTWEEMDNMRKKAADKVCRDIEKIFLKNLLNNNDGNISKAAKKIGVNRSSLYKMMKKSL